MAFERLMCGLMELKFADDTETEAMTFTGYGAVFNNVDGGGDLIEPGAFSAFLADVKSGKQRWPAMMSQHGGYGMTADDMTPVGIWTDLAEDGHGLKVSGKFADTPRGIELYKLSKMMPRPAIDSLSIGYIAKDWTPRTSPDEPRRRLKRIDLIEISPVTRPMNEKAKITSVKSIDELESLPEFEDYLREAGGFSRAEAKGFIARIKQSIRGEADDGLAQITAALNGNITKLKG